MTRPEQDLRAFEFYQVVEAIHYRYGIDFREYAQASLLRRLEKFSTALGLSSLAVLVPKLLHEPECFEHLMKTLSMSVTSMFLDPPIFKEIREYILPMFEAYDQINVLHAGCGTGEEAYSMAIVLSEAGVLNKTKIQAVDFNTYALEVAKAGIYPAYKVQEFTKNYKNSGGQASFSEYYVAKYNLAKFSDFLRKGITFECRTLTDTLPLKAIDLILCRNVLIYFNRTLHDRVLFALEQSLRPGGVLVLGARETLTFSGFANRFEAMGGHGGIFRKRHGV